jgi:glycolate oxidase FAD binding subunit
MTIAPDTIEALADAVASSAPARLAIAGAGTKRPHADAERATAIDLTRLAGIAAYDPAECVVTARAGTRIADIVTALAAHGQYLPFDPPLVEVGATLGGVVATGWSGPSRYRYGGIRDFVIGARVVDGCGRIIASGGQVVKNAAGFLTHHALVGSAGRLGAIAEVSLKVFPAPETRVTLAARAPSLAEALAAHERVRLANLDLDALDLDAATTTVWIRLAGAEGAMPAGVEVLRRALARDADVLDGAHERQAWTTSAMHSRDRVRVVKVPSSPSRLASILAALAPIGDCRASVGGAVVCLATDAAPEAIATEIAALGLRAMIVRGPGTGDVLGLSHDGAFAARVRHALDPDSRFV